MPGPDDELKDLADTFDRLLERLDAAFEAQRAFVANASHELRTPLTFERSLLEVALADPDATAADLRAACERVLEGNRHQERLIEALLTLARGQRGIGRSEHLDLAEVAGRLIEDVRAEAAARDVRVDVELCPAPSSGDVRLVERLTANLLDNAVRHNVADGHMTVRTGIDDGRPVLRVANSGPIVPPDRIDAILQPFERLDGPRTGADDGLGLGLGLGLSIIAAIADAHDADLVIQQRPEGGLDIQVALPTRESRQRGSALGTDRARFQGRDQNSPVGQLPPRPRF